MSDLIDFAREHGILIDSIPPLGSWKRFPTEDHPNSTMRLFKTMHLCKRSKCGRETKRWNAGN